jgi:Tol biopolymer transport system component
MLRFTHGLAASALLLCTFGASAQPVLVGRVTNPVTDVQANGTTRDPALSGDGRYLFFVSSANSLGPPANGSLNLYRYDLSSIPQPADALILAMSGLGSGNSFAPTASTSGARFAFETLASNLGGNDSVFTDIYAGVEVALPQGEVGFDLFLVSRGLGNAQPNEESRTPSISGDGRFVAFYSGASNLVAGDNNGDPDIFLADIENLGAPIERISVDDNEVPFAGPSFFLSNRSITEDGRYVVFTANAPAGTTTNISDIFLRDRTAGSTTLVSRLTNGTPFNGSSDQAAISANGRFVVFRSFASNAPNPSGSRIWLLDRSTNVIAGVPLPPEAASCEEPRVSNDADVIMQCNSALVGTSAQAFLYRGVDGGIYRLSSSVTNANGNGSSGDFMDMNQDGDFIAFDSAASNLVPNDTNNTTDVLLVVEDRILNGIFSDGFE